MSTDPAVQPEAKGIWVDQSTRMQGDRFVCGDCGAVWPVGVLGEPFEHDRCHRGCGGRLTAIWDVYPGQAPPPAADSVAVPPEAYEAAGLALVPFGDDEDPSYFEWHECSDRPNCSVVAEGQPCACSGMPWPSPAVRAAIDAAAPFLVAEGRRQAAEAIRQHLALLPGSGFTALRSDLEWAARIAEGNTDATM